MAARGLVATIKMDDGNFGARPGKGKVVWEEHDNFVRSPESGSVAYQMAQRLVNQGDRNAPTACWTWKL